MATRPLLIAAIVLASAAGAAAQEPASRAAELASRQAEKATALHPEQKNWIERRILAVEDSGGLLVPHGFFVSFGGIKTGSGVAPGIGYGRLLDNGALVQAKVNSIRNFKLAEIWYLSQAVAGGRLRFSTRARWQDAPSLPFYALGTQPSRLRADYSETKTEISAGADFRPVRSCNSAVPSASSDSTRGQAVRRSRVSRPSSRTCPATTPTRTTSTRQPRPRSIPGLRPAIRAAVRFSARRCTTTTNGAAARMRSSVWTAWLNNTCRSSTANSVLYAGLHVSTTTASQGSEVPFFLMPYVGGTDLRGYENYRFRGRHSIAFTAEYRWYAQEYLDAASSTTPERPSPGAQTWTFPASSDVARVCGCTVRARRCCVSKPRGVAKGFAS